MINITGENKLYGCGGNGSYYNGNMIELYNKTNELGINGGIGSDVMEGGDGVDHTGSGGGGQGNNKYRSGNGGSGIVIIKCYPNTVLDIAPITYLLNDYLNQEPIKINNYLIYLYDERYDNGNGQTEYELNFNVGINIELLIVAGGGASGSISNIETN